MEDQVLEIDSVDELRKILSFYSNIFRKSMLLITRNCELKKAGDFECLLQDGGTEWKMMYLRKNFFLMMSVMRT